MSNALAEAVIDGLQPHSSIYAACFNPRHGVRATASEGTVDLVVCFECAYVEVYYPLEGAERADTDLAPSWSLNAPLTKALTQAGIKVLPNPWDKQAPKPQSGGRMP